MAKLLGLSGSLRTSSFNTSLLRAAKELAPKGSTFEIASIRGIPLYDEDVEEKEGIPAVVRALKDQLAGADGLVLATPEYNGSIPGVMKNAIDWLSRPSSDIGRVFGNRAVGIIGATPGPAGTRLAQTAWLPVTRQLTMRPYFGRALYVASAGNVFDKEGTLVDAKVRELLTAYLEGFATFAASK